MVTHIIKTIFNSYVFQVIYSKIFRTKSRIWRRNYYLTTKRSNKEEIRRNVFILLKDVEHTQKMKRKCFILKTKMYTARYYAEFLNNYRLCKKHKSRRMFIKFVKTVIYLTIKNMDVFDQIIIKNLLGKVNVNVTSDPNFKFEDSLMRLVNAEPELLMILKFLLEKWMDIMPILNELKKLTDWNNLLLCNAHLLNSDELFDIYLNLIK